MRVNRVKFQKRIDRVQYMVDNFKDYLTGKVLDVGCDEAYLRHLLPECEYTGIDINGNPDIKVNLENIEKLPFDDNYFDSVICSDVLEHIDNLHFVFGELIRVAKKYIVISLPNNWVNARRPIQKGRGTIGHYGLPIYPTKDRHKWFFNLSEAKTFLEAQTDHYPITIIQLCVIEKPKLFIFRWARRILYPSQKSYLNRYSHTLCAVFEKS